MNALSTATEIVNATRISEVYRALTGKEPRPSGAGKWRASAVWRGGDSLNVALNDVRGAWFDHVTGRGGGVLDLVVLVRGGTRSDALRWVAQLAGVPINDEKPSAADLVRLAAERRRVNAELPSARLWRRTAVLLFEELLGELKDGLSDSSAPMRPEHHELRDLTAQHNRLQRIDGAELVAEFCSFRSARPGLTAAFIRTAAKLARVDRAVALAVAKGRV